MRANTRGRWRVELRVREHRLRETVAVGGSAPAVRGLPTLPATGDSTMQGINNFLADDLGDAVSVRHGYQETISYRGHEVDVREPDAST